MQTSGYTLLTGATGFLGRYLLRELLAAGRHVAVLARDARSRPAEERVRELLAAWPEPPRDRSANPVVLAGDLDAPHLGLSLAQRAWLARRCSCIVHAAADVALRRTQARDPWTTNVEGTQRLLDLCAAAGIGELHHVSTAFVCGSRPGPVLEDEFDCGQVLHNDYERSKFEAERRVRACPQVRVTVYRPSVIVGDSQSGFTSSYHGFYRFLELGSRLAGSPRPAAGGGGRRMLPLRLPFTGEEPRNLVPVDWVARAIASLVDQPPHHGRTYHLVARTPVRARQIKAIAADVLGIDGVQWTNPATFQPPTPLEETFLEQLREYWPYFHGDPIFDDRNTQAALPHLPPPRIDRPLLERLIRFAVADRWGRVGRRQHSDRSTFRCGPYLEEFFPQAVAQSALARIPLEITIGLDIVGPGGGQWSCYLGDGTAQVHRRLIGATEVLYRMSRAVFEDLVHGRQSPQEAFFARRIEIEGDIEKGLKLAVLFEHFTREYPYSQDSQREKADAGPVYA